MKNIFTSLFFLLNFCILTIAQNSPYERLSNQDLLPEDYITPSFDKYTESLKKSNRNEDSFENEKDREKFYLEITYAVDELLRSGYILYNDPIGKYVNKVLEVVVESNPILKEKKPRVYILRSTAVNAFALDQGIIFMSIGLLSQLENEAQLALILAHELVHVQENHGLEEFLETIKVDRKLSKNKRLNTKQLDIAALEKNRYSRDQEMEADDLGLTYFLNTNYSFESIQRVFDILRYSYLPFDEIVFEKNVLEKISVSLPVELFLEEVKAINPAEEDEEQSTHPALSKRNEQFAQRLKGMAVNEKKDYLISKESFLDIQLRSRVELARLFLNRQSLAEAIYAGFLMTKIYGETDFTREIIGKALYGLSKYHNNELSEKLTSPYYKDIEGQSQQVFHLIHKLSDKELNILAIAYNYHRYLNAPDNKTLRALIVDLFADLHMFHEANSLNEFYTIELPETANDTTSLDKGKELSKIDKIKQNRKGKKEGDVKWHLLAFSEVLNDTDFRSIATEGFKAGKKLQEEKDHFSSSTYEGRRNLQNYRNKINKKGRSLGVKKVLVVNPLFIHLDGSKSKPKLGRIKSNQRRVALKEIISSSAVLNDVKVEFIDGNSLKANDVDQLNDLVATKEWVDNQFNTEGFLSLGYNQEYIEKIASKYGTDYFLSLSVISQEPSTFLGRLFNKNIKSFLAVTIFDVTNGRRSYIKSDFGPHYLDDVFLKSELYDVFFQISK